jgi:hypothetical protein
MPGKNIPEVDSRVLSRISCVREEKIESRVPKDGPEVSTVGKETLDIRDGSGRAGSRFHHEVAEYNAS